MTACKACQARPPVPHGEVCGWCIAAIPALLRGGLTLDEAHVVLAHRAQRQAAAEVTP